MSKRAPSACALRTTWPPTGVFLNALCKRFMTADDEQLRVGVQTQVRIDHVDPELHVSVLRMEHGRRGDVVDELGHGRAARDGVCRTPDVPRRARDR